MDWNALKIFLAVAQTGTLAGAANKLGVNHSTVFRRLQSFEEEVGGRLFERINNRYTLTLMGQEMLEKGKGIEDSFDTLERQVVGKDFQPKGIVKITAPTNIAYRLLPGYLESFRLAYPDIHIELLVSNLEFNMSNRQADIAVRATPSPPEHLVGRKVRNITWGIYAGNAYIRKFGKPSNIKDLKTHSIIGATGNLSGLPAFTWLDKEHFQQISIRSDELVAISYLAEAGHGLALLPDDQARPELNKLFTVEVGSKSDLWLLTHPDLRNVERIKLVMQHLTQAFANG